MLTIRAVSFKGRPLDRELVARFEETGGTIGRGEGNTLVLSDPERFISRTHATIAFQAGGYLITDTGTKNPVMVNGRPLGSGSQARLGDGDQIKVGDYLLQVALTASRAPLASSVAPAAPSSFDRDPFADLLAPPPSPPRAEPVLSSQGPPARPPAQSPFPDLSDPLAGIRAPEPSIDDLLGSKPSGGRDFLPDDFLAEKPAASPSQPPLPGSLEDLLGMFPKPTTPSVPDHGPEIHTPYSPPVAKPEKPEPVVRPEPVARPKAEAPPTPPVIPRPSASVAPAPESVSAAPAGPQEQALLRAFLQGAGLSSIQSKSLTPETMEAIGKLLREAVQGTLDLLRARGLTKSEMRADVTMIMATDNNPLKFSPTVEAALTHLLSGQVHGFMPPLRAMKEAYDDLRAHQLGFLAGMRAALEEVLARFAPQELAKRLTEQSMLDDLLPMNRKAKLWDLFLERHAAISGEAREDFNAVFGKAFRRAYEAQVKQLRDNRG